MVRRIRRSKGELPIAISVPSRGTRRRRCAQLARHLYGPIPVLVEMSSPKRLMGPARRTALVVEDDPRLQRVMGKQFGRMGFHVLSASHYDAAVRHLATREPDVACIDVGLPSKSGYELCEHMRRALGLAGLPIILTSEYGSPGDMANAEDAGGNAFLRKPFTMRHLTYCVESLINPTRWSAPPRHELQPRASKPKSTGYVANRRAQSASLS
jgi:DNA-binding response OmpR family regulator